MLGPVWMGLTAVSAVFGLVCAARLLVELLCPLRQLRVAVEVCDDTDAGNLDLLLHEACAASRRGARPVVLLPASLTAGGEIPPDIAAVLDRWGADCYLIGE